MRTRDLQVREGAFIQAWVGEGALDPVLVFPSPLSQHHLLSPLPLEDH